MIVKKCVKCRFSVRRGNYNNFIGIGCNIDVEFTLKWIFFFIIFSYNVQNNEKTSPESFFSYFFFWIFAARIQIGFH